MALTDFDFQAYIQTRRGAGSDEAPASGFGIYAFRRDRNILEKLERTRLVGHALRVTAKLETGFFHDQVLDVSERIDAGPTFELLTDLCTRFGVAVPRVWKSEKLEQPSILLGFDGQHHIIVSEGALKAGHESNLTFWLGRHIGQIQNGHVPYLTAAFALEHESEAFYGIVVKPPQMAIAAWARLGDITADRAGLLACGSLDHAIAALESVSELPEAADDGTEDDDEDDHESGRAAALMAFANSTIFLQSVGETGGDPLNSVDTTVEGIVKAW